MYSITCDNNEGMRITFDTKGFNPFVLARVEGIYKTDNTVYTTDNTIIDGATEVGVVAKKRNIILTIMDKPNNVYNQDNRDVLYALFSVHSKGTLTYEENGKERVIDYRVEKVYRTKPTSPFIIVSLICPDPYFYDKEPTVISLANWVGDFEFEHEFAGKTVSERETIGHREQNRLALIDNDTFAGDLGMTITLTAKGGAVRNPKITRVEDGAMLQIGTGTGDYKFVMQDGSKIIITTGLDNKKILYEYEGETTSIIQYITVDSTFLQIVKGMNTIGYSADHGETYLVVEIQYKRKYEGA